MIPLLLLAIAAIAVFLGVMAWSARSSKQPLNSIDTFSRALEAMEPDASTPGRTPPTDGELEHSQPDRDGS